MDHEDKPRPIVSSAPRDRVLENFQREVVPSSVKTMLASALHGDLRNYEKLVAAMVDSWPRLATNLKKIADKASATDWTINAWAPRGEKPSKRATKYASEVEAALWGMRSNALHRYRGFKGTIKDLAFTYYSGHGVNEIMWDATGEGNLQWTPTATKNLTSRFYRYPSSAGDEDDVLMLNKGGQATTNTLESFDNYPSKFLVGIRQAHRGHPTMTSPLRALTSWWLAANYGLKWFMQFSQLYGIPLRWATYPTGDNEARQELCTGMEAMGSCGWVVAPDGAEIKIHESSKGASELPQKQLIEIADRMCDIMILGATLTSDTGGSGSRALGGVHQDTECDAVESVVEFIEEILNEQLIPFIMEENYGETKEIPWIKGKQSRPKDELAQSQVIKTLVGELGMEVAEDWLFDKFQIPQPGPGEKVFKPKEQEAFNPQDVKTNKDLDTKKPEINPGPTDSDNPDSPQAQRAQAKIMASHRDEVVDKVMSKVSGGVSAKYLGGVKPEFDRLIALAISDNVEDEDFLRAVKSANRQLPEVFGNTLNTESLRQAFEDVSGEGVMQGALDALE